MSRRSKETLAVQLFPFLAVLVCTMGSLIFLLLVTTRQIRQRAVAFAAHQLAQQQLAAIEPIPLPPPAAPLPQPEEKPEIPVIVIPPQPVREAKPVKVPDQSYALALADRERELSDLETKWKLRVDQLTKAREGQLAALARRKDLADKATELAQSAKSEVDKLETQLGKLAGESAAALMQAPDEADRLLLEKQIAELKKRLKAAQLAEASAENEKFQVIPFDPQTGTTRRPIFIECTREGIRFIPEDILITAADLDGFTSRTNPLAAGTGALINYWTAWNFKQRNHKAEAEPYVLMLVRPNGECAYYAALRMLEPIRTAHGYELIEESTSLHLPEVDIGAKAACQAAVDRLLAERENIYRAAMNNGSASSVFGGTGRIGGSGSASGKASGSGTAAGSYAERMAGIRRAEGNSFTVNDVTGGGNSVDERSWERVDSFEGRQRRRRGGGGAGSGSGNGGGSGTQDPEGLANAQPSGGGTGTASDPSSNPQPPGSRSSISDPSAVFNQQKGQSGSAGTPEGTPAGSQYSAQGNPRNSRGGMSGASGRQGSAAANDALLSGPSNGSSEPEPGMPIGQNPRKKRGKSSQTPDSQSDATAGDSGDDVADGDGTGQSGSGSSFQSGSRPGSAGMSDSGSSPRNANGSKLSSSSMSSNRQSNKSSDNPDRKLEPEMLAGRRWGFSEAGASIGFEREVRVDVSSDKLVIAEKFTIPIEQDATKEETFEQFATTLDRYSHEWGRPPQGFFWTPRLKFVVKKEAYVNYEQINAMMTRAGLGTSHEFAKESTIVEFGREGPAPIKIPKTAANPTSGGIR